MTNEELIKELRNSKGWPTLGNAAADRIERLLSSNKAYRDLIRELDKIIMEMKHA